MYRRGGGEEDEKGSIKEDMHACRVRRQDE
jgi:hypothetical protein